MLRVFTRQVEGWRVGQSADFDGSTWGQIVRRTELSLEEFSFDASVAARLFLALTQQNRISQLARQ